MRKSLKLFILAGVLVVICGAAFFISRHEKKQEQIKSTGDIILEIPTESVTALSWTNETGTYSFTKGDCWNYDGDAAFPVDTEKINSLLEPFVSYAAAFTIEDVDDYGQYGLATPICSISITADGAQYTVTLGDYSKMDQQRYVSIGDGNAYLAQYDPKVDFDAELKDMILDDTVPNFDIANQIVFAGAVNETIVRNEEGKSLCSNDIYFIGDKPLDTDNVSAILSTVRKLSLKNYATYNVSEEELTAFGQDQPDLTTTIDYSMEDTDGNVTNTGMFSIVLSRNTEELAAYSEAVANEETSLPDVTCYIRLNESQIIYEISESVYKTLMDVSYDSLRHKDMFTGDFATVTSFDVTIEEEVYTFTYQAPTEGDESSEEGTWLYNGAETDIADIQSAITAVTADSFTDEAPSGQVEISVMLRMDNEDYPTFELTLYRYDGAYCLAAVNGTTEALVPRSQVVDLTEAIYAITLNTGNN